MLTLVLAVASLGACGEGTGDEDAGDGADARGTDAAMAMDAGEGTDAGTAMDGGADAGDTTDAGDATDAGPTMDGGAVADAGIDAGPMIDASTDAVITLSDVGVYGDCMPSVDPDPIVALWTTNVTGAAGSVATLTSATLTVTGPPTFTQVLTVDTPTIALTGGSGSEIQRKTGSDRDPPGTCSSLCSGRNYTLELTFMVDGASVVVTDSGAFSCVF